MCGETSAARRKGWLLAWMCFTLCLLLVGLRVPIVEGEDDVVTWVQWPTLMRTYDLFPDS